MSTFPYTRFKDERRSDLIISSDTSFLAAVRDATAQAAGFISIPILTTNQSCPGGPVRVRDIRDSTGPRT
jgi:hypothetical protein